jgi:hypothetical protein
MSDQASEMEAQLRTLMKIAAGDQPRRVDVEAIRRLARRRAIASVAAAMSVVLIGGAGVAVAAKSIGGQTVGSGPLPAGVPRYYFEQGFGYAEHPVNVIRATASGAVTASVRCPGPGRTLVGTVVAVRQDTFFMICQSYAGKWPSHVVTGARIYRFTLTSSGRIPGYVPVPGGNLAGLSANDLAATPGGSRVAVAVAPAARARSGSDQIVVIDPKAGTRTSWLWPKKVPGRIYFELGRMSLTGNGKELAVDAQARCVTQKKTFRCKATGGEQVRAFDIAGAGGKIGEGRVILRQSAIMRPSADNLLGAFISLDGTSITLTEAGTDGPGSAGFVEVLRVSATNSRDRHTIFRLRTGNGWSNQVLTADPSQRHLILVAGPGLRTLNGWIDHGRLRPLTPKAGNDISQETW